MYSITGKAIIDIDAFPYRFMASKRIEIAPAIGCARAGEQRIQRMKLQTVPLDYYGEQ